MGQQPNDLTPGAGPWHRWGYELRQFREARRLSQQALARKALIDRSHLGRFERAERPVPRPAAVVLDRVLDAAGALVRYWDEAERESPQDGSAMTSRAETEVHEANTRSHGASGLGPLALSGPGQALSLGDDMDLVVVPARINGRIHFMHVPRRVVLASGLAGLAAAAVPATTATAESDSADMGSPFEHFAQLRRVIGQTDNLIGPRHVLPAASGVPGSIPCTSTQPEPAPSLRSVTTSGPRPTSTTPSRCFHPRTAGPPGSPEGFVRVRKVPVPSPSALPPSLMPVLRGELP
ncbi:helix-turn-helix domain-containing protein [Streptomyces sp. 021-4]|uniref:helix-turn-helix domain-containing protein n=1 Tax=Streptomyces sp. 021-4 TaxID=2789260 RepID=UPI0039F5C49D